MLDSAERTRFRRQLISWFDRNQRDLPWRKNRTRYRIWVSEIMLQQTQVVTVVDYFQRFIERFTDVSSLATAKEAEVLKLWEGLGYYRRARQMHAAAQQIVKEHGGRFPDQFDAVLALPGIGRYSAGAILSIADNQPLPIVEGNTIRVYSRLMNFTEDVTKTAGQKALWSFAESLVTQHRPGDLNQALMELGSEVCTKSSPNCVACPVSNHCLAFQQGQPEELPNKGTKRTQYEALYQTAVVIERKGRFVVRLCGPDEHWSGLWDFPRFTLPASPSHNRPQLICNETEKRTGLRVEVETPFLNLKHAVTRFRIELECFRSVTVSGRLRSHANFKWVSPEELADLAMSVTGRKIVKQIL